VQDLLGEVEVPEDPERVVVLWSRGLPEVAVELGAEVVGATTEGGTLSPLIPADVAEGITSVGDTAEPDLEQVAALEPDLVLAFDLTVEGEALEQYREIAPVFVIDGTNLFATPWRDVITTVATAVGEEERAGELIGELDDRIAALRPRLEERYAGQTFGLASAFTDTEAGVVGPAHPAGSVFDELGLQRPAEHRIAEPTLILGPEEVARVDADHLFYWRWGYGGEPAALDGSPLWPSLRSVAAGQAYEVDGQAWTVPVPAAVRVVLDDVERTLLDG
jgi:iron complex transport system substrate-binding protein